MCSIASFLKQLRQKNLVWIKASGLKPFDGSSLEAQPPGIEARHEGSPGWRALWAYVGIGEAHPIPTELLHPRSFEARVVP